MPARSLAEILPCPMLEAGPPDSTFPGIFWMGTLMRMYALNRHHFNSRVSDYTQAAARRLYGIMGFAVFFGTDVNDWLATWAILALILVPGSILDLWRIRKEDWQDVQWEEE